jgi:hypothetical protein
MAQRLALLEDCTAPRKVDAEIPADLDEAQRVALRELPGVLAEAKGFTYKR